MGGKKLTTQAIHGSPTERGPRLLVQWTQSGTLIPAHELAEAWGMTGQALDASVNKGQLAKVLVNGHAWFPCVFKEQQANHVAQVCEAFGQAEAVDHMMFWIREHGALGGKSVPQALNDPELGLPAVVRLAQAHRQERVSETECAELAVGADLKGFDRIMNRQTGAQPRDGDEV